MYREGDWIIETGLGLTGTVSKVWERGVTAKFGEMTAIRGFEHIQHAPLDIQADDISSMIDLALQTGDKEWFESLIKRMGVEISG